MSKSLNLKFEEAVRLLTKHMAPSDENSRKPVLFHDIRVGTYLYENSYSSDIVLAGILHDAIEWSEITEDMIQEKFGKTVLKLVLASTKDDSITDKTEKTNELINRCIQNGQDALIVKAADIIDSFKWYSSQNNEEQLKNHCMKNANAILASKPDNFEDEIFNELKKWQEKFTL
jgi:(p)ppGpp synthase/HD superfamily hydrolase